jgi:Fe-S-cluster-containing hydrogenase component 2
MEAIKSGVIVHIPKTCSACGICEIMCSLRYEGVAGPALSRANITPDPFTTKHTHTICQQCAYPSCYYSCPLPDTALCIDESTGARYINEAECINCGACVEACPFEPSRIKTNPEKQFPFKCDLCRGRAEGPICVEYCPFQALKLVPKNER